MKTLRNRLSQEPHVLFAYIHGSSLRRRDARDIDVAVYLKGADDPWTRAQEIASRLEKALDYLLPVDVHDLNSTTPAFAFEVLNGGRLLWEKDPQARHLWEAHALSRYQDIKPMLDFHDRRFLQA